MIGILLASIATLFGEFFSASGKYEVQRKKEDLFTMGFLSLLWATVIFFIIVFVIRKEFIFSFSSLPTFSLRAILEIIQAHIAIKAIIKADRSTFTFLRVLTLPLLLLVDVALGYQIGLFQSIGIGIIVLILILTFSNNRIGRKGRGLVIFTAINAVVTISLFKYNITHFNSVDSEQLLISSIVLIYFFSGALLISRRNPFKLLSQPVFLGQSLASGVGAVFISFAYLFAPASVITTAKRSSTLIWSLLSGKLVFQEKRFLFKIIILIILISGIILLAI